MVQLVGGQHLAQAPGHGITGRAVGADHGGAARRVGVLGDQQRLGAALVFDLPQVAELFGGAGVQEKGAVDAVQVDHDLIEVEQDEELGARPAGNQVVLVAADADVDPAATESGIAKQIVAGLIGDDVVLVADEGRWSRVLDDALQRLGPRRGQGGERRAGYCGWC